jgi:hypothetical protein
MFSEDLNAFFDTESGFAVDALYEGSAIAVVFDERHAVVSGYEDDISDTRPQVLCKASDVSGAVQGSLISIKKAGETEYTGFVIADVQQDGTGLITLILNDG